MKDMAKAIPDGRPNMIALGIASRLLGFSTSSKSRRRSRNVWPTRDRPPSRRAWPASRPDSARRQASTSARNSPRRRTSAARRWLLSGNEATALGAIRGGIRFAAAYPITPATEILEWLAPNLAKVGGTLLQAEDELAAINMIIGASFGGTPALTATSGPGLSLMIEALGLATSAEIPIVVVDVMRGGPSTGIPTKSEQADLNIAVYGMHGDAPHLVLAPQSVGDCVFTTQWATYLAETLQAPAIVLSDQFMGQSRAAIERPADVAFIGARDHRHRNHRHLQALRHGGQRRVADGDSGNARRSIYRRRPHPFRARHPDQRSRRPSGPTRQAARQARPVQLRRPLGERRRHRRYSRSSPGARSPAPRAKRSGAPPRMASTSASSRRVCWRRSNQNGSLPPSTGVKRILVVEQTHGGQFHKYLRAHYDLPAPVRVFNRPGPLPITAGEIHRAITEWR